MNGWRISLRRTFNNLRHQRGYHERALVFVKTRPTKVAIGERRKPEPGGRPGYLRVDTVHQGDLDGVKGVYHINLVDEVTQWQVMGAVGRISEGYLKPLLECLLTQFPFAILGFHSDNGSEFINHTIATLLNKLLIEQTKSRPRHSGDNGQVEAKNGAVIRRHMGYDHIASEHAGRINGFYEEYFNPYLNFHRPCAVPELKTDSRGKTVRTYRWYATPWEILRQVPGLSRFLKDDLTIDQLEKRAGADSEYRGGHENERSKTEAVRPLRTKTNRMNGKGCGNAGLWTARKTKGRFSIVAHQPLEIADAIPTFPQPRPLPRGKVEIQKPDSHFPTLCFTSLSKSKTKKRKEPASPVNLVLQAHLWIGKDSGPDLKSLARYGDPGAIWEAGRGAPRRAKAARS